jgi:hypothetical protein
MYILQGYLDGCNLLIEVFARVRLRPKVDIPHPTKHSAWLWH